MFIKAKLDNLYFNIMNATMQNVYNAKLNSLYNNTSILQCSVCIIALWCL